LASKESKEAIKEALDEDIFSYTVSVGNSSARESVASYVNENNLKQASESKQINANDVILTNGCSAALEMCFRVLANIGENVLIPRPSWNYRFFQS
jgi:tyrosine aminotransferase